MTLHPSRSHSFPFSQHVFAGGEVPIRYFDDGAPGDARPAIVFIHGLGANLTHFEYIAADMAARGFRVAGLDLPGFGLSGKPHRIYTIHYLSTALAAWCAARGLVDVTLCGHSLGGLVACDVARRRLMPLGRLVLVSPAGLYALPLPLRLVGSAVMRPLLLEQALARNARRLLGRVFHKENARTRRFVEDAVTRPDARFIADLARVMSAARADLLRYHLLDKAPEIAVPTLVIWGERDRLLPFSEVPRWVARLPSGKLEVIPACGHMSIIEEPGEVVARMSAFLRPYVS